MKKCEGNGRGDGSAVYRHVADQSPGRGAARAGGAQCIYSGPSLPRAKRTRQRRLRQIYWCQLLDVEQCREIQQTYFT